MSRLAWLGLGVEHRGRLAAHVASQQLFRARCALAAHSAPGGHVELHIDPSARIHPRVRVDVWTGTHTIVSVGADARIGELTSLSLRGGQLTIGADTDVRRLGTLNVAGDLRVGRGVVLSTGVSLHCAEQLSIGDLTIVGEWSTLADSAHTRTPAGVPIHHSVTAAPLAVGANCWLGARVTVASGLTIGDQAVVGSGAVVTRDVAQGWLVAGVPARNIRHVDDPESS